MSLFRNYIGVTGFMLWSEVQAAVDYIPQSIGSHGLMIGVLASSKTLAGETNKYPRRYPRMENISELFPDDHRCLNLIHYATDDQATLSDQLVRLMDIGGSNCHGIQLNIAWPDYAVLEEFRARYPEKTIVLQCGHSAMLREGNSPDALAKRIKYCYGGLCDYVLIDPSGGRGSLLDSDMAHLYLKALREHVSEYLSFGVAGGLSAATLDCVDSLIRDYSDFSIDAEGRLRDNNDDLDICEMRLYLQSAYGKFSNGR